MRIFIKILLWIPIIGIPLFNHRYAVIKNEKVIFEWYMWNITCIILLFVGLIYKFL